MSPGPSENVRLYGTEEAPQPARVIACGALSVTLQNGALRYISMGPHEAIRGIAFVVRDKDWGTYIPEVSNLCAEIADDGFSIRYDAECGDGAQVLSYSATIKGAADGTLQFVVEGVARSPFLTSRTGFVVLHPVDGVAGAPVTVTHTDGSVEQRKFPGLIQPSQPFTDIRALRHEVASGLAVTCTMQGDAFEMEDQRNWTDASFKTYIRPLAKPHPFTLEPDHNFVQQVDLAFEGETPAVASATTDAPITLKVETGEAGVLPEIALAAQPDYLRDVPDLSPLISRCGVTRLFCTFDASAGHDAGDMAEFRRIGEETGADLVLEAILSLRDADGQFTDDPAVLDAEVSAIERMADDAGVRFSRVSPSPACYLKSHQPSGPWPKAPSMDQVFAAIREAFPAAEIAAGMHSYFTEFNRHPPPIETADLVTHSTSPIVHAADDVSVMETLQALPWVFDSARTLGKGKPYWIGPTTIGMRFNPYGSMTMPNPHNVRGAMVTLDPRQRGLFNAAWTLGYISRAAAGGVNGLCLSAVSGPGAIAWQKMDWPQPWFDELAIANTPFPVFHVIAGLACRAGAPLRTVACSSPSEIAALAFDTGGGTELWLANLTQEQRQVTLEVPGDGLTVQRLDAATFEVCSQSPDGLAVTSSRLETAVVNLNAYAVLRVS